MSPQPFISAEAATGGHRVCVSVGATALSELLEMAAKALVEAPFVELRLDSLLSTLHDPAQLCSSVASLFEQHRDARLIATCRRVAAGGNFQGTPAEELRILFAAVAGGCSIADLSVESSEELGTEQVTGVRKQLHAQGAALLVSYHHYQHTPDLSQCFARIQRFQPDIAKIVSTATALSDNLAVLQLLGSSAAMSMVAMAMGEQGIPSRVLGLRAGGLFTFASASTGAETAAGQLDAATLNHLYRVQELGPATRIFGVAGDPLHHSLSPLVHNAAFQAAGIDAVFLPLLTHSVKDLLRLVREFPLAGLSITMPLKQALLPCLDELDPLAARVGACNTLIRTGEGALRGYNTDVDGVIAPLERRMPLPGARILVRGAGGAARAAVFGLCDWGADVWILNRTRATAERLALDAGARVLDMEELEGQSFDVLLNAVPAGMAGLPLAQGLADSQAPDSDALVTSLLGCAKLVFDMVYNPPETPLLRQARAQAIPVISGWEMFVQQAVRQFELWTGSKAPESAMTRAVLDRLLTS